ncbi:MAG: hypothetical protein AAF544_08705 [Bacteroidota bacterium]
MLEPEDQYSVQNPGGFYDANEPTNFTASNRSDLSTAGGWALFLAILSILSLLFSVASLSVLPRLSGEEALFTLLFTLVGLGINGAVAYWYFVFYNSARAIGLGSEQAKDAQRLSSSVLATFRLFGILTVIFLLFYLSALAFTVVGLNRIF